MRLQVSPCFKGCILFEQILHETKTVELSIRFFHVFLPQLFQHEVKLFLVGYFLSSR